MKLNKKVIGLLIGLMIVPQTTAFADNKPIGIPDAPIKLEVPEGAELIGGNKNNEPIGIPDAPYELLNVPKGCKLISIKRYKNLVIRVFITKNGHKRTYVTNR